MGNESLPQSVVMVRLVNVDICKDSRVLREAQSLSKELSVSLYDVLHDGGEISRFSLGEVDVWLCPLLSMRLPKSAMLFPLKYMEFFIRVLLRIVRRKPRIIHAHDLPPLPIAWVAGRLIGSKVIYDSHELATEQDDPENTMKKIWRKVERFLLGRVDGVIAANESRAQIMQREYGAPRMPVVVMNIPEPAEIVESNILREFVAKRGARCGANSKIILYQGALSFKRGLEELVAAFSELPEEYVCVLMGYGELGSTLQRLIVEYNLHERVFIHEAVLARDLHKYTCSADVGIVSYKNTCRNKYYCAPNKLFEYAMAGIPIAGADLPEIRKIVQKYDVGWLFDPEDSRSIAGAIEHILTDANRYKQIKRNLALIKKDFTWDNEYAKLKGLYNSLLS